MGVDSLIGVGGAGIKEGAGGLLKGSEGRAQPSGDLLHANRLGFEIGTVRDSLKNPTGAATAVERIAAAPPVSQPPSLDTAHKPGEHNLGADVTHLVNANDRIVPKAENAESWRGDKQKPVATKVVDGETPVADTTGGLTPEKQARLDELRQKSPDGTGLPIAERVEMAKLQQAKAEVDAAATAEETKARKLFEDVDRGVIELTALTPEQVALMEKFEPQFEKEKTVVAIQDANGETVIPVSAAQKMGDITRRREQLIADGKDKKRVGIPTLTRLPEAQMVKGASGELGEDQAKYDTYVQEIERKLDNGIKLTGDEAQDYQVHLDAKEQRVGMELTQEASGIGADITSEVATTGKVSPETQKRMFDFLNAASGGKLTKDTLMQKLFDFDALDSKQKGLVAKKMQEALAKMTPEVAKEITARLQILVQLEFQALNAQSNVQEATQNVWDVKEFLEKHKKSFDIQDGEDAQGPKSFERRMKWIQAQHTLNEHKQRLYQALSIKTIVAQQYRETRNFVEHHLGQKGLIRSGLSYLRNETMNKWESFAFSMSHDYSTIEGRVRPPDPTGKHKTLELNHLLPA